MEKERACTVNGENRASGNVGRTSLLEGSNVVGASGAESGLRVGILLLPLCGVEGRAIV